MNSTHLVWYRRDLRVADHRPLFEAMSSARAQGQRVKCLYIATPAQWQQHHFAAIGVDYLERHLNLLAAALASLGVELDVVELADFSLIPSWFAEYRQQQRLVAVYAHSEPEWNERQRDEAVGAVVPLHLFDEHCLLAPGTVLTQQGSMYQVFTPFSRQWKQLALQQDIQPLPVPAPMGSVFTPAAPIVLRARKRDSSLFMAGEGPARRQLQGFIAGKLHHYADCRDLPAVLGTSGLSPWLALGVLSPRQCLAEVLASVTDALSETSPAKTWVNELIWREFYRHLLVIYPRLSRGKNFNPKADAIQWRNLPDEFERWCQGQTGYPLVDAAMRQLNQTGWMHNRLRMVTASFLTKHLLIDWRWGEAYFSQQLIDADLAANNGGWQWSAGTGCDAQPYFRVFNPLLQSKKYDPDAEFIRKYVPELAGQQTKNIHQLNNLNSSSQQAYPAPMVEHSLARTRALQAFAVMKA
ncbi:deoxyribodipyrimidine photo-lyase [Shewanella sp. NIFS-20-20]|uniref:deoxyribodipyrimidine photo-lyase n=1 Tax=Shewanella sp. NIFS-20-20 TaxID=2853806 RepID=UPI001C469239|nr:deoxyribodipyrimidine photo-lyase [Shewanella sp. NIFS-20-20]MBV7314507.1 deoxyribodipyrimidine photo-lyase [Shewanella sp. NIFS-20-20]